MLAAVLGRLSWWSHPFAWAPLTVLVADTVPTDPTGGFLGYGAVGATVLALATGFFVPKPSHDEVKRRLERAEAQNEAVLPALQAIQAALADIAKAQAAQAELLKRRRT